MYRVRGSLCACIQLAAFRKYHHDGGGGVVILVILMLTLRVPRTGS